MDDDARGDARTLVERMRREGEREEAHRELLAAMERPFADVRPAVLSAASAGALHHLLGFRRFFRHAYDVDLDLAQVEGHAAAVRQAHPARVSDLDRFRAHLEAIAAAIE